MQLGGVLPGVALANRLAVLNQRLGDRRLHAIEHGLGDRVWILGINQQSLIWGEKFGERRLVGRDNRQSRGDRF